MVAEDTMRLKPTLLTLLLVISVVVVTIAVAQEPPNRSGQTKKIVISPDYPIPAGGIDGLWAHSDLVIMGRVTASQPRQTRHETIEIATLPLLAHKVAIVEVFKQPNGTHLAENELIDLEQEAGEVQVADRVIEVNRDKYDVLKPGGNYVLFLSKYQDKDVYVLAAGPHSVYSISQGRATTQGKSGLKAGTADEIVVKLRELRQAVK
jgi:hypothetical protein